MATTSFCTPRVAPLLLLLAATTCLSTRADDDTQPERRGAWSASPALAQKLARPGVNYDESRVPAYVLPDPLRFSNNRPVDNGEAWTSRRRGELLGLFRDNVYGRRPGTGYSVAFSQTDERDAFDGAATARAVQATISIGDRTFSFPFVVFVPKGAGAPAPAVVLINNRARVSIDEATRAPGDAGEPFWPVRALLDRGYAAAAFYTSDVDPDRKDGYADGIRGFFADGRPPDDQAWGALSAWGWGASRVLDYLDTLPEVDGTRVAVAGHSRGGKAALWGACEDPRFAAAYSNNSGCGGAALSRRAYGETVGTITKALPYWFCKAFSRYAGREDGLPVDQHEVIALIAPRGVYVTSADADLWADPKGEYAAVVAAAPVFELLGEHAITTPEMPPLNAPRVAGRTGYHIRDGGHGLEHKDWEWFLDFADPVLKRP
ncbi:hypothetical protein Pla175_00460 [Pirellulimonas nuda]|uniref:4-O-methyl-glucuronoyl methylesterase-like domain-containing protein n=1 Tax=Pirellulimonas nuda TaxID=2528009 RepID=A0A518D5E7_9BACT|nr:acetylxylan esterase [Pirellulimonas nuda]QDU86696.1 hypothetical protein Pla175_00460 [Pirellulimonas nuda]